MHYPTDPMDAFRAFEIDGWNDRASTYDDFFGRITACVVDPLLDAAHVALGSRVLDVGTGTGSAAVRAAERGAIVVGIDPAAQMLARSTATYPNAALCRAEAARLPFRDGAFDVVIANFLMPHLAHPAQELAEMVRVAALGGTIALTTWDLPERSRLQGVFLDAVRAAGAAPPPGLPPGPPSFPFADDVEFRRLLLAAGLEETGVQTLAFTYRVDGADTLWNGVLSGTVRTRPLVLGQPLDMQRRIRAEFDRIVRAYEAPGGGLDLPISVKLASGRKPGGAR
ncbi:MAG: class I SAM-dependent methyltransferase [Chloroflexia bacterium]